MHDETIQKALWSGKFAAQRFGTTGLGLWRLPRGLLHHSESVLSEVEALFPFYRLFRFGFGLFLHAPSMPPDRS